MEGIGLILLGLGLLFQNYFVFFAVLAFSIEAYSRYAVSKSLEKKDKEYLHALFSLSSVDKLTEFEIARIFPAVSRTFKRTGKLELPRFGWRSEIAILAIKSSLDTGSIAPIVKAIEQISKEEDARAEAGSLQASQKYGLIASLVVTSAIMGITSSISGKSYAIYVFLQSVLSSIWLSFMGTNFYQSLSLFLPLSLSVYFIALKHL